MRLQRTVIAIAGCFSEKMQLRLMRCLNDTIGGIELPGEVSSWSLTYYSNSPTGLPTGYWG